MRSHKGHRQVRANVADLDRYGEACHFKNRDACGTLISNPFVNREPSRAQRAECNAYRDRKERFAKYRGAS